MTKSQEDLRLPKLAQNSAVKQHQELFVTDNMMHQKALKEEVLRQMQTNQNKNKVLQQYMEAEVRRRTKAIARKSIKLSRALPQYKLRSRYSREVSSSASSDADASRHKNLSSFSREVLKTPLTQLKGKFN